MTKLLSVDEAQRSILGVFHPVDHIDVNLEDCLGRVLSQDIAATIDLPSFTNSSMDGYAVQAADVSRASLEQPVRLVVSTESAAGSSLATTIKTGEAARIMTGAPLPEGADAVIPVEDTRNPADNLVEILRPVQAGDYLRPRGMDVRAGQAILERGRRIRPQDAGMLAMLGHARVPVYRRPRVALMSSGNELVEPGHTLAPGQIYDANRYALGALIQSAGADLLSLGACPDDPEEVSARLDRGVAAGVDLIITTAGVSVGAYDFIRQVLDQRGHLMLWRVDMRPGKPVAFGRYGGVPLIGLPGNPVSAFVTFMVFIHPVLRRLQGVSDTRLRRRLAVTTAPLESDGRESYLRGVVHADGDRWLAAPDPNQSSANMFSLVQANALLIVPSGVKSLPIGAKVEFWSLGDGLDE
ncbi:MAG TPA: gephyrin-like molybdotransferase Glp [Anaerolineaceae bacterium]|nr:gephyrin-like molybdotransferase Glp [Anaerolineaceae bacterium]